MKRPSFAHGKSPMIVAVIKEKTTPEQLHVQAMVDAYRALGEL